MAETQSRKKTSSRATAASAKEPVQQAQAESIAEEGVNYLGKSKKKKKRKYSRGTKDFQRLVRGQVKGAWRLSKGLEDGMRSFNKRYRRSENKRKDGAARDLLRNSARAWEKSFRQFGKAPYDVARQVRTKTVWRTIRPAVTFWAGPFR